MRELSDMTKEEMTSLGDGYANVLNAGDSIDSKRANTAPLKVCITL